MADDGTDQPWCQLLAEDVLAGLTHRQDASEPGGKPELSVHVPITRRCSWACPFCVIPLQSPAVQQADVAEVIESAVRRGARKVVLSGGEPTLEEDLPRLIEPSASQRSGSGYLEHFRFISAMRGSGSWLATERYFLPATPP